jgi:hypothetical protein
MKLRKHLLSALFVAAVIALSAVTTSTQGYGTGTYTGWYYSSAWWTWPFNYCYWSYTDFGGGSWWYEDDCGSSYGSMNLD